VSNAQGSRATTSGSFSLHGESRSTGDMAGADPATRARCPRYSKKLSADTLPRVAVRPDEANAQTIEVCQAPGRGANPAKPGDSPGPGCHMLQGPTRNQIEANSRLTTKIAYRVPSAARGLIEQACEVASAVRWIPTQRHLQPTAVHSVPRHFKAPRSSLGCPEIQTALPQGVAFRACGRSDVPQPDKSGRHARGRGGSPTKLSFFLSLRASRQCLCVRQN